MARPSKYNQTLSDNICKSLQAGATRTASAESNGLDYDTFRVWVRDKKEFSAAVMRAEAQAEMRMTLAVTKAVQDGDAKFALEWLKRRRRAEWGDNIAIGADKAVAGYLAELFPEDAGNSAGSPPLGIAP